jgi:hypothetical protein
MTFEEWWGKKQQLLIRDADVGTVSLRELSEAAWDAAYQEAYRELFKAREMAEAQIQEGEMQRLKNFRTLL